MKQMYTIILFFAVCHTSAQNYSSPESVEYDYARNCYYISNTQSHQILKKTSGGSLSVFASGITTGPHGLEIVADTLYACSGGFLRAYDLNTGNLIFSQNIGASFLNGITHKDNNLFITDFSAKKVYRFNTVNKQFNEYIPTQNKTPNGIIYDDLNDRLVMVSWGANAPVFQILLSDSSITQIALTSLGNCDGIAMNCNGQFYVSSWSPNRISRFENDFMSAPINMNATGLSSPADIVFNKNTDTLAVPNSGNNTVTFYHYASCNSLSTEQEELNYVLFDRFNDWLINLNIFSVYYVELFDVKGSLIRAKEYTGNSISIDKPSDKGIYFLKIYFTDSFKIVKLYNGN